MSNTIDEVWPTQRTELNDADLLGLYEPPTTPWLRMGFISSLDGAATRNRHSGGLGDASDQRILHLLRRWADVVLVGAGTARTEGYGAMWLSAEAAHWRENLGLHPHPAFALVTRHLDLDPTSPIFRSAPRPPLIYTVEDAPAEQRTKLEEVATVITAGPDSVEPAMVRADLIQRGLKRIHCEGGPSLFGTFITAGLVDELCLTVAPSLEGGDAPRISHHPETTTPEYLELAGILRSGSELFLRYRKDASLKDKEVENRNA
ncbi:pyrimidine reductase family protein [Actinomyces minihominis]|uniref:pyrimidine reductase family protein n=1 Tax=Actinomyces minihominis TaxID=2002838 RepID=UPI000C0775CD|nr:pyrimidine reductase family protein [Actinomyces minihominis]